jgi:guanylate kinase
MPPSFEVLKARLTSRNTESPENLALRLRNAHGEVEQYTRFDYVIVNDEVLVAARKLAAIIIAERQRLVRQSDHIKAIMGSFVHVNSTSTGE